MANDLSECLRCGAMVDRMSKHKRWHQQLEGTSDPLPPDPDKKPARIISI